MSEQEFEELLITLKELYSANRYLDFIELSKPAIEYAYDLKLYDRILLLLRYKCVSYSQIGNLKKGISVLEKYREVTIKYGTDIDFMHYYSLASMYWTVFDQRRKSEENMLKALEIAKRNKHVEILGKIYNSLSYLEVKLGDFQKARNFALKSLYYLNTLENKHDQPYTWGMHPKTNLALAYIGLENIQKANQLLQELLATIQHPPYNKGQLEVFVAYALLCEKQGDLAKAIKIYQKAKYYAQQNNDLSLLQTIYSSLVRLIEQQGNQVVLCAVQKEYIHVLLEIQKENYSQVLFDMEYSDQKKQFEKKVYTDPLTSIYNRRYFDEHAANILKNAADKNRRFALLMIDLDHFKSINDAYGHLCGDDALVLTASTLEKFFEFYEDSIVARFGGDEFIVLTKIIPGETAKSITESLFKELKTLSLLVSEEIVNLEFSIGVSTNDDGKITEVEQIIKNADNALYTSKRNGRNQITLYKHYNDIGKSI